LGLKLTKLDSLCIKVYMNTRSFTNIQTSSWSVVYFNTLHRTLKSFSDTVSSIVERQVEEVFSWESSFPFVCNPQTVVSALHRHGDLVVIA
jgi:hypothetical protein